MEIMQTIKTSKGLLRRNLRRVSKTVQIIYFFLAVAVTVNTSNLFFEVCTALCEGSSELCVLVAVCCASTDLNTSTVNERIIL